MVIKIFRPTKCSRQAGLPHKIHWSFPKAKTDHFKMDIIIRSVKEIKITEQPLSVKKQVDPQLPLITDEEPMFCHTHLFSLKIKLFVRMRKNFYYSNQNEQLTKIIWN